MRFGLVILAVLAAALTTYAGSSRACCGSCEGDHHGKQPAAPEAPKAKMAVQKDEARSFDGSTAPEAVILEPARLVIYKATLSDPAAAWTTLPGLAGAQGLLGSDTHAWSVVPTMPDMDDMESMADLPYWAAFTIGADAQPSGELEVYTSPGGKYVEAVHRGPYEKLGETWEKFARHVMGAGHYDASRPMLENYVSDPGNTPQEDLITQLYIPVK
jgi:hypothetical protein